jgi:hypothetical protein
MSAQAWVAYGVRQLGPSGRLGASLLLLGVLFYALVWLPAAARSEALVRESDALRERLRVANDPAAVARAADEDPLTRFYRTFPATGTAVSSLGQIYGHARARGLALERGEYRLVDDRAGRLIAYQADLPVRGSYVQIREFLGAVLADLPFAALEEVAFERRRISDATIEAKVRLTLYVARDT